MHIISIKIFLIFSHLVSAHFRIYSDIDDTAIASGSNGFRSDIAGKDKTLSSGKRYAGYESFVYHLATEGIKPLPPFVEIDICTSRPKIVFTKVHKEELERRLNSKGSSRVKIRKIHYGHFMFFPSYKGYATQKYKQMKKDLTGENRKKEKKQEIKKLEREIRKLRRSRSEDNTEKIGEISGEIEKLKSSGEEGEKEKVIFLGDNGQGDALAARKLLEENLIDYAFIHAVVAEPKFHVEHPRIFYFKDYLMAAKIANEKRFISDEALDNIKQDHENDVNRFYTFIEKVMM